MAENNNSNDISVEAGIGIAALGAAAFFATIDAFWLKSYNLDLTSIQQTQFGWITFFAALSALFAVAAVGLIGYSLFRKFAPMVGYISKVLLGIWGIALTLAVAYLVLKSFGIGIGH